MKLCITVMTNSLQAHIKIGLQFLIKSILNLMTIFLQIHTKTSSKLKFCEKNLPPDRSLPKIQKSTFQLK
jgi:hypothetical protein